MTDAPPLADGEVVVFDHVPTLKAFRRAAVILLLFSLLPTVAFSVVFPETYWVILPLFLACMLLVQERFKMGRHRAWITNQRVLTQTDALVLSDIASVKSAWGSVRLIANASGKTLSLPYSDDKAALINAIESARKEAK